MAVIAQPGNLPPQIQRRLRIGAALTVLSVALCVLDLPSVGGFMAVAGVTLLVWNLHRLGRTGPA